MSDIELDESKLYVVDSSDDTVHLALEPVFTDGMMCWFDTLRPRQIPGKLKAKSKTGATFLSDEGVRYDFRVVTLAEFRAKIAPTLEVAPTFASDAELHQFYVDNF